MRFILTIKPTIVEAPTKAALMSAIMQRFNISYVSGGGADRVYSGYGNAWRNDRADEYMVGMNIHKFRRKTRVIKKRKMIDSRRVNPDTGKPFHVWPREVVREKKWVAYCYKFPLDAVKQFRQGTRNFTVELNPLA